MQVTGERILVVEDDHFIGLASETTLTLAGYTARLARTAEQAIALAHEFRPDLLVVDINLGRGRDGIDVAAELLHDLGIRSIFATAYSYGGLQARADAARPLGWLGKPFTSLSLVTEVRRALQAVIDGRPIALAADGATKTLLATVDGVLTDEVWSALQDTVARFVAARGPHRRIVDFSAVTRVDVTQRELLARASRAPGPDDMTSGQAYVAPNDYLFALCRMFTMHRASQGMPAATVVRSRDDAYLALDLTNPDFQPVGAAL